MSSLYLISVGEEAHSQKDEIHLCEDEKATNEADVQDSSQISRHSHDVEIFGKTLIFNESYGS